MGWDGWPSLRHGPHPGPVSPSTRRTRGWRRRDKAIDWPMPFSIHAWPGFEVAGSDLAGSRGKRSVGVTLWSLGWWIPVGVSPEDLEVQVFTPGTSASWRLQVRTTYKLPLLPNSNVTRVWILQLLQLVDCFEGIPLISSFVLGTFFFVRRLRIDLLVPRVHIHPVPFR